MLIMLAIIQFVALLSPLFLFFIIKALRKERKKRLSMPAIIFCYLSGISIVTRFFWLLDRTFHITSTSPFGFDVMTTLHGFGIIPYFSNYEFPILTTCLLLNFFLLLSFVTGVKRICIYALFIFVTFVPLGTIQSDSIALFVFVGLLIAEEIVHQKKRSTLKSIPSNSSIEPDKC